MKDLYITSIRQWETMLTYGGVNLPDDGVLFINLKELYSVVFPSNFTVNANMKLNKYAQSLFGNGLNVTGHMCIDDTGIETLPGALKVGKDLSMSYTKIKRLPPDLIVEGRLIMINTPRGFNKTKDKKRAHIPNTVKISGEIIKTTAQITHARYFSPIGYSEDPYRTIQ